MKRFFAALLACLLLFGMTACAEKAPAQTQEPPQEPAAEVTAAPVQTQEAGTVLTVQKNLALNAEGQKHLDNASWLDQTTEVLMVDDIPAVITYRNDGGKNKPVYIVPHPTWGSKEAMLEMMPTGVSDINALFLSFDIAGYGGSSRSKGTREQAAADSVADIDKLLTYLAALDMADLDRIIIEGAELGADVALAYAQSGKFTPAIVTVTDPAGEVKTHEQTKVLQNVDFEVRNAAYQEFLIHKTAVENPEPEAVTVKEGVYTAPETPETVPPTAPAATVATVPPATTVPPAPPETTQPAAEAPAPEAPASNGEVYTVSLTVERNRPLSEGVQQHLSNNSGYIVPVESIKVDDLAAIISYRSNGKKKPVYVYCHGSGGGKEEGLTFMESVVMDVDGIFVSFDMPYGGESTHEMRTVTGAEVICGAVPEIDKLLAYVSTIPEADMNNIYLHGMSGGAASALAYMSQGVFTPSLLIVTVPCFDFDTYGDNGPPYNVIRADGDPNPPLDKAQIKAIMDEHNAYTHAERLMDTYVLAGIGLAGPPNAEFDGKQMEEKFRQMGKTDYAFHFYPGVDHNIPGEFYDAANARMEEMRAGGKIVNPAVKATVTTK